MVNGNDGVVPKPPGFDDAVKEWERRAKEHQEQINVDQGRLEQLSAQLPEPVQPIAALVNILTLGLARAPVLPARAKEIRSEIITVEADLERSIFYADLYASLPVHIAAGDVTNLEDYLATTTVPANITPEELEELRVSVDSMVAMMTGVRPLPEMAEEAVPVELPELVPPTAVTVPPETINQLTISAIIKSLTAPSIPPSVMSEDEWADFMVESGQISNKADLESLDFIRSESKRLIDARLERDNMLAEYRTNIAEMPDYGIVDLLKEMVVMPGLGLLEVAGMYFEHVSAPLAGFFWGQIVGINDIDVAYQRYKKEEGTWMALSHAWEEWDAPFEGAGEWILKYILMEGLVDPLTYVGWGIATKITKPLGGFGRIVGSAERGLTAALELPFDLIKAGIRKLPKTVAQRATLSLRKAGQYVDVYMTDRFGKALYKLTMQEWDEGVQSAVRYTMNNPRIDNIVTRAGRELLKHKPVSEREVLDWAKRLGSTLTPDDITKHTIDSVDRVFEDFFISSGFRKKLVAPREGADELVRILFGQQTDDVSALAVKMLTNRRTGILSSARVFGRSKTPFGALHQLMRRNYRLHIDIEDSVVALARREMGTVSGLLTDIPIRVQKIWQTQIDRWIVRPFAESYLTFALYGPMNVIEDVIRTVLSSDVRGFISPARKSPQAFARKWAGVSYDPMIMRDAVSETYGVLTRRPKGELNNWILQLGGLAKGFGDNTYDILVRRPGQIGADLRRNFLDRRASQILKDLGGDEYLRLANVAVDFTGTANRKINREVTQAATDMASQGLPEALRASADDFTRKKIVRREVSNIMKEHPDLPMPVRDFVMRQYDDGLLMTSPTSIDDIIGRDANRVMTDDFIQSARYAHEGYEQLADLLTQMEVRNPQEMAQLIQSLNIMSSQYGATPKQILGRAVERTRGLPFAERRLSIDTVLDDITIFRNRAGASMDRVTDRIKAQMGTVFPDNPNYVSRADNLFNLQTAKRLRAQELGEGINAWRHEWFAAADPSDLRSGSFWDDFSTEISSRYHDYNVEMARFDGQIKGAIDDLDLAGGIRPRQRPSIKVTGRELSPQDVGQLIGARGDDITRALMDVMTSQNDRDMFVEFVMAHVRDGDIGFTRESVGAVYDQIWSGLHVPDAGWLSGRQRELEAVRQELHGLFNSKMLPDDEVARIGAYFSQTVDAVEDLTTTLVPGRGKKPPTRVVKEEFANYGNIRQQAMDEAHTWYYKEFTDYTNANAFDSILKAIYPFWTYESQRWFWLPRSFVRHPGTFTSFERWQDNTEYGYIHIPGTSVDINPFRGTIYGTLTTRLTRRDYPEYYDSLGAAGGVIEFSDFLSRYGFYPGAHIGLPLAVFGGVEMQFGEAMPAIVKTPLDALIALFPDNESVRWISDHVFGDRFRNYLTILTVNRLGGDGSLIFSKQKENIQLTEEEEQLWADARREVGWYSAGFEQFALFRMRTDDQYKLYEEAGKAIEEMTGYTPQQQKWIRQHGYRLWDLVGGMSPTEQAVLQELDYYRWVGNIRPLLPGRQQEILNKIEVSWNVVKEYGNRVQQNKVQLQRDLLSGTIGPDAYNSQLQDVYGNQREFILNKMAEQLTEPIPEGLTDVEREEWIESHSLMTLEGRKDYYKRFNVPQPVLHPMSELINLFFSIKLEEMVDPETGEKRLDWDTFWALRQAVEEAIPEEYQQEWQDFLSKNSTRIEQVRREVYSTYFRTYNKVWEKILTTYPDDEQKLIEEYLSLERRGMNLGRQDQIKAIRSEKTGNALVSGFRSEVANAKQALRFANPNLDAWLYFWGRTSTFVAPEGEEIYRRLAKEVGRRI